MPCQENEVSGAVKAAMVGMSISGCGSRGAATNWVQADRVPLSRAGLGMTVLGGFDSVPSRNAKGQIAHVRGIYLDAIANVTLTSGFAAVSAHRLRSIWSNMFLADVSGHHYFEGLDGRSILDDVYFRNRRAVQFPSTMYASGDGPSVPGPGLDAPSYTQVVTAGIDTDASLGSQNVNVSLYIPFQHFRRGEVNIGSSTEGLVPLDAFKGRGADAFKFNIRSTIAGTNTNVAFNGLFLNEGGFTTPGFDIWLDIVYLDAVVIDAPWTVRTYTKAELSGMLEQGDRLTEYAYIRNLDDDADPAASTDVGIRQAILFTNITVNAGNDALMSAYPVERAVKRTYMIHGSDADSALSRNDANTELPLRLTDGRAAAVCLVPARSRDASPVGQIKYEFTSRVTATTRFLHRTVGQQTESRLTAIGAAALNGKCSQVGGVTIDRNISAFAPAVLA